jgi:cytochrome c-type biogenesis protein CcmH
LKARPLPICLIALLVLTCMTIGVAMTLAAAPKATVQAVSEGLTCQCGCGLTVANCNHPQCEFSLPVRTQIEAMIGKGTGGPEIIAYFRGKYGEKILSAPTREGFNLLAWIMPLAVIAAGGGIIFMAVARWNAKPSAPSPVAVSDFGDNDSELRRRLERELKEQL